MPCCGERAQAGRVVRAGFPRERQVHGGHGEDSDALRAALARDWERGGRLHKTFQDPTRG